MVWIPGGTFQMGSNRHYPEEAPAHRVTVDAFWIDRIPVTNREFRNFVSATGYVTFAEIAPDPNDYPGALPNMLRAGSLVFNPPKHAVDTRNWTPARQCCNPTAWGEIRRPRLRRHLDGDESIGPRCHFEHYLAQIYSAGILRGLTGGADDRAAQRRRPRVGQVSNGFTGLRVRGGQSRRSGRTGLCCHDPRPA
jgi:Sulfatase-modifying factor enzyme 1